MRKQKLWDLEEKMNMIAHTSHRNISLECLGGCGYLLLNYCIVSVVNLS